MRIGFPIPAIWHSVEWTHIAITRRRPVGPVVEKCSSGTHLRFKYCNASEPSIIGDHPKNRVIVHAYCGLVTVGETSHPPCRKHARHQQRRHAYLSSPWLEILAHRQRLTTTLINANRPSSQSVRHSGVIWKRKRERLSVL